MTQEEKQLLLQDLCARLPYGVICNIWFKDSGEWKNEDMKLSGLFNDTSQMFFTNINGSAYSDEFKPYLRPMSSMTEEEENEYRAINCYEGLFTHNEDALDYALEHHLDFRGLIPMRLALEAPEGIYNAKTE